MSEVENPIVRELILKFSGVNSYTSLVDEDLAVKQGAMFNTLRN